jgi:hypothetical protein
MPLSVAQLSSDFGGLGVCLVMPSLALDGSAAPASRVMAGVAELAGAI